MSYKTLKEYFRHMRVNGANGTSPPVFHSRVRLCAQLFQQDYIVKVPEEIVIQEERRPESPLVPLTIRVVSKDRKIISEEIILNQENHLNDPYIGQLS